MTDKLLVVRTEEGQPVSGGQLARELKSAMVSIDQTLSQAVIMPTKGVRASTPRKRDTVCGC